MNSLRVVFLDRAALSRICESSYVGRLHLHACPAQWLTAIAHLLAIAMCGAWNEPTVAEEIQERPKYPIKMDATTDAQPDRPGTELSYNYMYSPTRMAEEWLLITQMSETQ